MFFYAVLWISILRPFPNILVGSAFGVDRILDLLTVAIALFFFAGRCVFRGKVSCPQGIYPPLIVFAVLSACLPLAYWNSIVLHNEQTGIRDVFELVRFPIMLVMILFLAQARVDSVNLRQWVRKAFLWPYWVVLILCIADIVTIPVLSDVKHVLWEQSKNSIDFSYSRFRISGTLENPNWFSLYLNMMLSLFLFFETRTPKSILGVFTCIGLIVLTGSRTGMIGLLLVALIYSVASCLRVVRRPVSGMMRLVVIGGILAGGLYVLGSMTHLRITQSVALIRSRGILGIESANARASQVKSLIHKYSEEPRLLGFGPSKYSVADVIDNQYAEYLVRYGVVGLSLMILTHIYYGFVAARGRSLCGNRAARDYCLFVCVLALLMLVYFATGQFGDVLRLTLIYFGFVTPVFRLTRGDEGSRVADARSPCVMGESAVAAG